MTKFCPNCGGGLTEGAKFCASCGTKFAVEPPPPVEPTPTENIPQQQQNVQPMPMQPPRKSNTKIIALIAVAVVAVIIVVALFFMLQGGAGQFIGTWKVVSVDGEAPQAGFSTSIEFFTNGSFTTTSSSPYGTGTIYWGSYEIKGDQICGQSIYGGESECSSYSFSNGNRRLTISTSDSTSVWEKV